MFKALKVEDIRKRLIFTFLMLIVIRIGTQMPLPGVNTDYFAEWFEEYAGSLGFFGAITGGSFENMSVFALGITPYITASIIMQLLTIAIPALEEMRKDGEEGRKKMTKITRFVTIGLSALEAVAMVVGFGKSGYLVEYNLINALTAICFLIAGSAVLMWIGERISERGIGNGISMVLIFNIISTMPQDVTSLYEQFISGKKIQYMIPIAAVIIAIILGLVVLVLILQGGERKIPVQYAKRTNTGKAGAIRSEIPLKVNTAGVIPVIFASSIMQFPVIIATLLGKSGSSWVKFLSQSYWFSTSQPVYTVGVLVYIGLLILFAYFYTDITFNPLEIADSLKKNGGTIPGIRPGKPTSDYLQEVLKYIIFIGAIGLTIVAVIPIILSGLFNASVSFGGTSIIIIAGVIIETFKEIEAKMAEHHYNGFLTAK